MHDSSNVSGGEGAEPTFDRVTKVLIVIHKYLENYYIIRFSACIINSSFLGIYSVIAINNKDEENFKVTLVGYKNKYRGLYIIRCICSGEQNIFRLFLPSSFYPHFIAFLIFGIFPSYILVSSLFCISS